MAAPAATVQTDAMTTFNDVSPGTYAVVVAAVEDSSTYEYEHTTVTVGQ